MKPIISFQEEKEQVLAIIADILSERKAAHIVPLHVLTTEIIGYGLMAALILISVVRTIIFYLMDKKGL